MDNTRRIYLDNIRWITVCIVVIYHVIYMYNGVQPFGVIGPFKEEQLQDAFQYLVYPWMMALLSHNHHFKWWFVFDPIRVLCLHA